MDKKIKIMILLLKFRDFEMPAFFFDMVYYGFELNKVKFYKKIPSNEIKNTICRQILFN